MIVIIIFLVYLLIAFMGTWYFIPFIKKMQWDMGSARMLLAILIGIIGFLILTVTLYMTGDEMTKNQYTLIIIFGTVMVIMIVGLSLLFMHYIRKMKYMQATFNIPGSASKDGSLSESTMTCLVEREQVMNLQKMFQPVGEQSNGDYGTNNANSIEDNSEEIHIIENEDDKLKK
jgi:hypothetical protein